MGYAPGSAVFLFPPWLPASQPGLTSGLFSLAGLAQRSG